MVFLICYIYDNIGFELGTYLYKNQNNIFRLLKAAVKAKVLEKGE